MTKDQALKLVKKFDAAVGHHMGAMLDDEETHIVFYSELTGSHSLSIADSDHKRVRSHWDGFCTNQPGGKKSCTDEGCAAYFASKKVSK